LRTQGGDFFLTGLGFVLEATLFGGAGAQRGFDFGEFAVAIAILRRAGVRRRDGEQQRERSKT
jgi:hypothetical protein